MPDPRLRRSLLIAPGNRRDRMAKAMMLPADVVVFDLEDAVPPEEKPRAREHVAEVLRVVLGPAERCVRVNAPGTAACAADLAALPLDRIDSLMVPKVERVEELVALEARLDDLEREAGRATPIDLIVSLETPRGMLNALAIADAGRRVSALFFGSGDYAAATGCALTPAALHWPRATLVAAAASAGLQAIDAAFFAAVKDAELTRADSRQARELGFSGKLVFHPIQIAVANEVFGPTPDEMAWAERVTSAHREAKARGLGTVMVDGTFVAIDILLMAERIQRQAQAIGARSAMA